MSYFPAISQNVVAVPENSSTSNIGIGDTYVGTGVGTFSSAGIQIMFHADENCTIYIEQSTDNVNWDIIDSYDYNASASTDGFGITVQAVGAYFRVRVRNNSISIATNVRLASVLCPIIEAVPRSLDEFGHMLTSVHSLRDEFNNKIKASPLGDLRVATPYRLVGQSFKGATIDTAFWTVSNSGAASSAGIGNGVVLLTSGTDNNGYAQLQSVQRGRFIAGVPNMFRALLRVQSLSAPKSKQRCGAFTVSGQTPVDGFWFGFDTVNGPSVNYAVNGSITTIPNGSFNGQYDNFTMDTNVHACEIVYYLGKVQYFIDDILVHTLTPTTTQLSYAFALPLTFTSINDSDGTTSATLEVWIAMIMRLGGGLSDPIAKYQNGAATAILLKNGPGRLRKIIYGKHPNGGKITLYDAITATNTIAVIEPPDGVFPGAIDMDMNFFTGLTYTTSTAGMEVTFIYE